MAFTYITGSGTQADPYVITDKNGWNELASYVQAGNKMEGEYVELGADIDFQTTTNNNEAFGNYGSNSCSTIGGNNSGLKTFQGTFDGKGHSLNRFYESSNYGIFYTSGNVVIKNLKIINLTGSYSAIAYTNESVSNKTPLIENIVLSSFVTSGDYHSGSLLSLVKNSSYSSNLMNTVTFVIRKCFCYGICGNYIYFTNNHAMIGMPYSVNSTNMMPNIQVSDCMLLNYVPIDSWYSYNSNITFTNIIAYYFCDLTSSITPYPSDSSLNSTNCYVVYHSEHSRIDNYFNQSWNRITPEDCLISSNFNNFDFIDTWKIDTSLGFPVPAFAYNKYIHIHATARGNIYSYTRELGINSSDFCYRYVGRYGLIEKGTDISFGVQLNTQDSNRLTKSNFVKLKNLTTGQTGEDYQLYSNIQTSLIYKYEITPCFDGDGTEENPFLIKTLNDFRAITEYAWSLNGYCSYLNGLTNWLSGYYASIENDIVYNDISNFNSWYTTSPSLNININGITYIYINGNNHKIIGMYNSNDRGVDFRETTIKNLKFDYLFGFISFGNNTNVYDCEFNGLFRFSGTRASFYRCFINMLPKNTNITAGVNRLCVNSSSTGYYSRPTFINCIINTSVYNLRASEVNPTFTSCILLGNYYRMGYSDRGDDYYPSFNNTYIIEDGVIKKDTIPGLTYISYNTYIHSTTSTYNNFDFTNVFELYNKVINSNNTYITIPILKNMAPRFSFISILNDDCYGLNTISAYYYMHKLPSYENTGEIQVSTTVTPNTDSYFTKWDDNDSTVATRSFTNYDDHYVTYNLLPNCGNILSGKGTETEPYLITNKTDLINIVNWYNTDGYGNQYRIYTSNPCYFKITNDIEYQDTTTWELWRDAEAQESFTPFRCFKGYIDGDGHTISGLYRSTFESSSSTYSADARLPSLFMCNNASPSDNSITYIKNLKITKSVLKRQFGNDSTSIRGISFIYGGTNCYLINCQFSGIINASVYQPIIAGMCIAGYYLYAENCISNIEITVSDCNLSGNYSNESISGMFLIGYNGYPYYNKNSIIKRCTNKSTINCTRTGTKCARYITGILAENSSYGYIPVDISESYNRGNITALNSRVAGIICCNSTNGYDRTTITNCYNCGNITTSSVTQGESSNYIRGNSGIEYRAARTITTCYNYGNVTDTIDSTYVFAISKFDSSSVNVSNCYYLENTATNAGGGTSLTAENFILPTSLAGFDFVNTWIVDQSAGRPKLINNYEGSSSSLIVTSSNPNYGTVSGGGDYDYGEIAVITATPFTGCEFIVWSDGKRTNPREIVVNRNMMFQAMFKGEYPIRVLDYYGLITFLTDLKTFIATNMATKVDKTQSGDYNTPVYFNSSGVPTPCTELDLDTSGNAGTATKLETSRNISGVPFDGTSDITIAPSDIGLGNVDNTSDMDKPVSTATQNALTVLADDITGITYDNITYQMIDDIFNE